MANYVNSNYFRVLGKRKGRRDAFCLTTCLGERGNNGVLGNSILNGPNGFAALYYCTVRHFFGEGVLMIRRRVLRALVSFRALTTIFITMFRTTILTRPMGNCQRLFRRGAISTPNLRRIRILFSKVFRHRGRTRGRVVKRVILIREGRKGGVTSFTICTSEHATNVTKVTILGPRFQTRRRGKRIVLTHGTSTKNAGVLLRRTRALGVLSGTLRRQRDMIFSCVTIFIGRRRTRIVSVRVLLTLLVRAIGVFSGRLVYLLIYSGLFITRLVSFKRDFIQRVRDATALPTIYGPQVRIKIGGTLFRGLSMVDDRLVLVSSLAGRILCPPRLSNDQLPSTRLLFVGLTIHGRRPTYSVVTLFPMVILRQQGSCALK